MVQSSLNRPVVMLGVWSRLFLYALNETVVVPRHMVRKNCYALRVRGHSMIDDHIQDSDIIVVERRETAENGESVVAMINGERVTLNLESPVDRYIQDLRH
ncbi:MAG: hypothetical protein GY792_09615 [Gammaproteobacteria bacterium]|nr:hypothetical protein [Gammaproteobacteria bacterium]